MLSNVTGGFGGSGGSGSSGLLQAAITSVTHIMQVIKRMTDLEIPLRASIQDFSEKQFIVFMII
jgi:hypothetical protein